MLCYSHVDVIPWIGAKFCAFIIHWPLQNCGWAGKRGSCLPLWLPTQIPPSNSSTKGSTCIHTMNEISNQGWLQSSFVFVFSYWLYLASAVASSLWENHYYFACVVLPPHSLASSTYRLLSRVLSFTSLDQFALPTRKWLFGAISCGLQSAPCVA